MIGGLKEGNCEIKLSDQRAVKYGFGVTSTEAATQQFAYQQVNSNIGRVL
jgi:hypothetical protein